MVERGEVERLRIEAYSEADYSGSPTGTFTAFVNPAEVTFAYEMEYASAQGQGTTNSRMDFLRVKPGELALTLFLDGTGANGRPLDVTEKVEEFKNTTGFHGKVHRTQYLKVLWGKLPVRRCVLKSASIAYKLFTPDGAPLRAVITANFTENSDDKTREAKAQNSSSDLTHARLIKAGDTLPALCFEIYGDPRFYLAVARANGLDNFRRLVPGTRVLFPPLEK